MQSFLDIRTLSFITGITALAMFLCMLHVAMRRKTFPGFYDWTAAALANSVGFLLLSLRHLMPDTGTVVVANGLIVFAVILICRGLKSFAQARQSNWLDTPAMMILILLFAYFTYWQPDVRARVVVISIFQAAYFLGAVSLAAGPVSRLLGETNYMLFLSLLTSGIWSILRMFLTWFWEGHIPDFMNSSVLQGLTFVVFLSCNILTMVGLISINSKRLENDLTSARQEIQSLQEFLPICANCKKIRDDQGYWKQVESYIAEQTGAEFTHGICPDCMRKLYPELGNKA